MMGEGLLTEPVSLRSNRFSGFWCVGETTEVVTTSRPSSIPSSWGFLPTQNGPFTR